MGGRRGQRRFAERRCLAHRRRRCVARWLHRRRGRRGVDVRSRDVPAAERGPDGSAGAGRLLARHAARRHLLRRPLRGVAGAHHTRGRREQLVALRESRLHASARGVHRRRRAAGVHQRRPGRSRVPGRWQAPVHRHRVAARLPGRRRQHLSLRQHAHPRSLQRLALGASHHPAVWHGRARSRPTS